MVARREDLVRTAEEWPVTDCATWPASRGTGLRTSTAICRAPPIRAGQPDPHSY